MSIAETLREIDAETNGFHHAARHLLRTKGSISGSAAVAAAGDNSRNFAAEAENLNDAARQYKASKQGYAYSLIRPIAVKVASQAVRAALKDGSAAGDPERDGPSRRKSLTVEEHKSLKAAPEFIQKQIQSADGRTLLETHPVLDAIESPNRLMTQFALMYCTGFSMFATGKAHWWMDSSSGTLQIYYLPAHWCRPVHTKERAFDSWKVVPPGTLESDAIPVAAEDMAYFSLPDPADPLGSLSAIQAQSRQINTFDEITKAHWTTMKNEGRPGIILSAGRLLDQNGKEGPRPVLTPDQRSQLIRAVRLAYSGVEMYGEPMILDGLIEDVKPYTLTPRDLDFPAGTKLVQDLLSLGIGVNRFVAGDVQETNRASAFVAFDVTYELVINPLITLISQVLTAWVGAKFPPAESGKKLLVWIEQAVARDADLRLQQITLLADADAITKNEMRAEFGYPPSDDPAADKLPQPELENPMPGRAVRPTSPAGRPASRGKSHEVSNRKLRKSERKAKKLSR